MENKFKAGDKVVCKPGFNNSEMEDDSKGAGAGYVSGKKFTIWRITETQYDNDNHFIAWPERGEFGIYLHALCFDTPLEIEHEKIMAEIWGAPKLINKLNNK